MIKFYKYYNGKEELVAEVPENEFRPFRDNEKFYVFTDTDPVTVMNDNFDTAGQLAIEKGYVQAEVDRKFTIMDIISKRWWHSGHVSTLLNNLVPSITSFDDLINIVWPQKPKP